MRDKCKWFTILMTLLLTAACGAEPTSPEVREPHLPAGAVYDDASVQGCVSDGYCGALPPISSTPSEPPPPDCNVWYDPDCGACATGSALSVPDHIGVSSVCSGGGTGPGDGGDPTPPGGGGPGAGPGTENPGDITCDPFLDPDCYKPLTGTDTATIRLALAQYLRPLSQIPDATARQECENMRNAYNTLFANGYVFRGATTTMKGDAGIEPHTGAYDPNTGRMHIDPRYLDAAATGAPDAMRELVDTLLHEAAHALMKYHPNGYVSTQWGPVFSDPYFNLLSPGVNSCIAW